MQIASGQLAMKLDNADVEFYSELDELDEPFDVVMTDEALYAYAEIPSKRVYARIGNLIDFLAEHPYLEKNTAPTIRRPFRPLTAGSSFARTTACTTTWMLSSETSASWQSRTIERTL